MKSFSYKIAQNKYGLYCVPLSSSYSFTSQAILDGKIHEPDTISYILKNVKDGDVIHSGACFGDFLPALSQIKSSIIWAFEPCEENFICAQKTIEINYLKNVKLMKLALGATNSVCTLKVRQDNKSLGPRCKIINPINTSLTLENELVVMKTLDSLIPETRKVSLIHLDVQGYENFIIQGASGIIARDNPLIILEEDSEGLDCDKLMDELNYRPIKYLDYKYGLKVFKNTVYKRIFSS